MPVISRAEVGFPVVGAKPPPQSGHRCPRLTVVMGHESWPTPWMNITSCTGNLVAVVTGGETVDHELWQNVGVVAASVHQGTGKRA